MRRHTIFSLLLIVLMLPAGAQNNKQQSFTRTVKVDKAYAVNQDCTVDLTNKYGNVHLVPWTKDSVVIEIGFTATANSAEKVDKIVNYIDFEFTHTKYYVVARTYFKDYANSLWTDISNMAGALFSGGNSVEINYVVHMPVKAHVKVDLKFGNVYTTNHDGSINLTLSNGDFKANNLNGDARLNISFGTANIQYIARGTLDINYCDYFDLRDVGDLIIHSKSSTITIEKAVSLDILSRRDKFTLTSVEDLSGDCSFTYLNIFGLQREARIESKYGTTSIQGISQTFTYIGIASTYTDNSISFDQGAQYRFELIFDKKTTLNLPGIFRGLSRVPVTSDDNLNQITGAKGSNPSSRMRIDSRAGSVTIVQK